MKTNKTIRQYAGILCAICTYYIVHEGAHLLYTVYLNVFKQIHFITLGIQIDVYAEKMSDVQLGIFCIIGSIATLFCAYFLVGCISKICKQNSPMFKAIMYYITIALLFIDPIYLSVLHFFVGGGDMNGISLLFPKIYACALYGIIFVINSIIFIKIILPAYTKAFQK